MAEPGPAVREAVLVGWEGVMTLPHSQGQGWLALLASTRFSPGNLYEVHDATLAFDAGSLGRQGKGVKAPQTSARGRGHWVTSRQEGQPQKSWCQRTRAICCLKLPP